MSQRRIGPAAYRIPESLPEELEELGRRVERLKAGEISDIEFRAFRVPQGVYEHRESGRFMLRCRFPAGVVLPSQMRCLARVSRQYGDGVLHVTTRQDIQVHAVPLEGMYPALVALLEGGIACKGGGGNTVRNVTGCPLAGVCAQELFDVVPYAAAVTEFLLVDPISFQLPRKYKIGFAGCARDCLGVRANDLGFVARRRNGRLGFAVYAGGGMGARSRLGELLEEFIPADQVHLVAEAVKRVFDAHGNRKNKHQARLRFFVEKAGFEAFAALYREKLEELRSSGITPLQVRESDAPRPMRRAAPSESNTPRAEPKIPSAPPQAEGFDRWRRLNVSPQKQDGYHIVNVPLLLGDIRAETLETLAGLVEEKGEGVLRTDQKQNALIRWVPEDALPAVHARLGRLGLAEPMVPLLRDLVVCTGAATCKLGICLSRGLAGAIRRKLTSNGLPLEKIEGVSIHINGCPNACGRHPLGQIGLHGAARRIRGRLVPFYVVQLGGRTGEDQSRLASGNLALPARNVPAFLGDFLTVFCQSAQFPDFHAFLDAEGRTTAEQIAAPYRQVPDFEDDKNFYYDWGADELFSLAGRGPGECGAGVFDLIEVDLHSAEHALAEGRLFSAVALSARALLVTRGEQPQREAESLAPFRRHFLETGLADPSFDALVREAEQAGAGADPESALADKGRAAASFLAAVKALFETIDTWLRPAAGTCPVEIRSPAQEPPPANEPAPAGPRADSQQDFRGVACPLNYVKAKMALDQLAPGQVLAVLLDDQGARNVPDSVAKDGHEVLSQERVGDHWRLVVRKKA